VADVSFFISCLFFFSCADAVKETKSRIEKEIKYFINYFLKVIALQRNNSDLLTIE